jgi:hypothetical protein
MLPSWLRFYLLFRFFFPSGLPIGRFPALLCYRHVADFRESSTVRKWDYFVFALLTLAVAVPPDLLCWWALEVPSYIDVPTALNLRQTWQTVDPDFFRRLQIFTKMRIWGISYPQIHGFPHCGLPVHRLGKMQG